MMDVSKLVRSASRVPLSQHAHTICGLASAYASLRLARNGWRRDKRRLWQRLHRRPGSDRLGCILSYVSTGVSETYFMKPEVCVSGVSGVSAVNRWRLPVCFTLTESIPNL